MKALTDKIIDRLEEVAEYTSNRKKFCEGLLKAIQVIRDFEDDADFEEVARIMMKHLGQGGKYHPHHTTIITNTTAELVEGKRSVGIVEDYIPD